MGDGKLQSRITLLLSVTKILPAWWRSLTVAPNSSKRLRTGWAANGTTSTGSGKMFSQVGHALRLVGNHNKALRNRGDNFLTQQSTTTTFEKRQVCVNLVGPIQIEIECWMGVQGGQRDFQSRSEALHRF